MSKYVVFESDSVYSIIHFTTYYNAKDIKISDLRSQSLN